MQVCVSLWELSVGMQPLSMAPHAGGWVCLRKVEEGWEGREGGSGEGSGGVDRAIYPQAEELEKGGGSLSPRASEADRKNRAGGWRLDVDTKCGVISHAVCVVGPRALNKLNIKTDES